MGTKCPSAASPGGVLVTLPPRAKSLAAHRRRNSPARNETSLSSPPHPSRLRRATFPPRGRLLRGTPSSAPFGGTYPLWPSAIVPTPFGLRPFPPDRGNRPLDKGSRPPVGGRLWVRSNGEEFGPLWDVWIHILGIGVECAFSSFRGRSCCGKESKRKFPTKTASLFSSPGKFDTKM